MTKNITKDILDQLKKFAEVAKISALEITINPKDLHIMAPGEANKAIEKNRLFIYGFIHPTETTYEWLSIGKGGIKGYISFADNFKSSSSPINLARSLEKEKKNPLYMPVKTIATAEWMIENLYRIHLYLPENTDPKVQHLLEAFLLVVNKTRFES